MKNNKVKAILIITLVILIPIVAIFNTIGMGGKRVQKLSLSDLFTIVNSANHNKGWVELSNEQVAGLAYTFVDTAIAQKESKIKVKNIKVQIEEDTLNIKVKGGIGILSAMVTIEGKPYYESERICYDISKVKIGSIPMPIEKILGKIQKSEGKLRVEGTTISADKKLDMIEIDGIKIENHKLYINVLSTLKKFNKIQSEAERHKVQAYKVQLEDFKNKIDSLLVNASEEEKKQLEEMKKKVDKVRDTLDLGTEESKKEVKDLMGQIKGDASKNESLKEEIDKIIGGSSNNNGKKEENKTEDKKDDKKEESTGSKDYSGIPFYELPKEELEKRQREGMTLLRSNLYALKGSISNSDELRIVNLGIATANSLITDPNYDFWGNVGTVQGIYNTFSAQQKEEFKNKIYSYIDMGNVFDLKEMFEY